MKIKSTPFLTAGLLLLAVTAQAQVTFSVGPRVGLNLANVPFKDQDRTYHTNARAGIEAGLLADIGFGHFALQPALLYSQKGFTVDDTYTTSDNAGTTVVTTLNEQYRLNYFTVPLNFVYAQRPDGQARYSQGPTPGCCWAATGNTSSTVLRPVVPYWRG